GTLGGGNLMASGRSSQPITGPSLNGVGFAAIPDTDEGVLDGDPEWDHAVGPMQFIPATWREVGRDGNGDGVADPLNIDDAALSAASYLCAGGRDLATAQAGPTPYSLTTGLSPTWAGCAARARHTPHSPVLPANSICNLPGPCRHRSRQTGRLRGPRTAMISPPGGACGTELGHRIGSFSLPGTGLPWAQEAARPGQPRHGGPSHDNARRRLHRYQLFLQ
ncbi:hypothetical protein AHiyo6_32570, partial [Arthrobacter sp. Hiyo6]